MKHFDRKLSLKLPPETAATGPVPKIAENIHSPVRLLLFIGLAVFACETFVMGVLYLLRILNPWIEALIDSTLLVILLAPVLYFGVFRLLVRHIAEHQLAQRELEKHRVHLKEMVAERTDSLTKTNKQLRLEIHERELAEETLTKRSRQLGERVKELKCLYAISKLMEQPDMPLDMVLQHTLELIPPAWQYPEITCARLTLENQPYATKNFSETRWKQACKIIAQGEQVGMLEVFYREPKPEVDEGPFLKEERNLINTLAELVGKIIHLKRTEAALRVALEASKKQAGEISALLEGARSVLHHRDFDTAARSIFAQCKDIIGARAGYVALLGKDGTENELQFLDPGAFSCTVDTELPMPVRGLRAETYRQGKTMLENDFAGTDWVKFLPDGHVDIENALFAPLVIDEKTVGLLGLANKPGGFNTDDVRIATAFGELAAVALLNSRALESLEASEDRFRSVVETAMDAIVCIDRSDRVMFWNQGAGSMFGYSAAEIEGQPIDIIIPRHFRKVHQAALHGAAISGITKKHGNTRKMSGIRKDGSKFPIELSLAKWKTREGIFFTAIIRDITDQQRAEDDIKVSLKEKEVLLQEVHHRVKNNMQVISSLLNLQAGKINEDGLRQMFQESQHRVKAMALIHETLYQSDSLSNINMQKYVSGLANSLMRMYGSSSGSIDLRVNVEAIQLGIDETVPCGLVINELISNSLKYAFPDGRPGEIGIDLYSTGNDEIILAVYDNGVGLPQGIDIHKTATLGFQLVTGLVEGQLGGALEMNSKNGTRFSICFPKNAYRNRI
jgi:PAS domain S-box-containing protein